MARDEEIREMRKTILLMQEELEGLKKPPFMPGTVLDVGQRAARISMDGGGIYEIPADEGLKRKVKRGSRVVLNPVTKSVIGYSEFASLGGEVATIDEVLDDRLRVQNKGESRIVLNSVEGVKPGDEVMLDPSKAVAVKGFSRKKTRYALEEVPIAPWTNIGGLEETIAKVRQEIEEPFIHRKVFERYGRKPVKGILLYGPPGCGKTMIARSIAYNLAQVNKEKRATNANGHFIKINGPEILDKWVGNSEANIRRIYGAAREAGSENGSPVVVFIDEAESVLKTRGSGISTDIYDSIVPQFLSEMDGLNEHNNVITVLATNREDIIDPAILRDGRVDRRIKVPRPNQKGTSEIFQIYLRDKPMQKTSKGKVVDPADLSKKLAEGIYDDENIVYAVVHPVNGVLGNFQYRDFISGAMIEGIIDRASTYAIQREIKGEKTGISQEDLERSIEEEFMEHTDFAQTLVRDDWEGVFGGQGRQYQKACAQGYLILENMLKNSAQNPTKLGEVKQ
ncbi:AAA family ATPase [Candidatus Pacearchaeota archaeon]|nr:AAA family ATPase [Candidatus Pacearchaeota archaeon]